jgi:hypothetical protein
MVRLETRVSNALRCIGIVPGSTPADTTTGRAVYDSEGPQGIPAVYVTTPEVTIGEILACATRGGNGSSTDVTVVLMNQIVGVFRVHGKPQGHLPCKKNN